MRPNEQVSELHERAHEERLWLKLTTDLARVAVPDLSFYRHWEGNVGNSPDTADFGVPERAANLVADCRDDDQRHGSQVTCRATGDDKSLQVALWLQDLDGNPAEDSADQECEPNVDGHEPPRRN